MAHLCGIKPWEWAYMTIEETDYIIAWVEGYEEQIRKANGKGA